MAPNPDETALETMSMEFNRARDGSIRKVVRTSVLFWQISPGIMDAARNNSWKIKILITGELPGSRMKDSPPEGAGLSVLGGKPGAASEQTCYLCRPRDREGRKTMGRFIFVSFGLLVVFLSLSGTAADCPPGWSSYEGHCYRVFKQRMNWEDAERACSQEAEGGHLASIHSRAESAFVAGLASETVRLFGVWIGLSGKRKPFQGPKWQWTDGSPFSYQSWNQGRPNNVVGIKYCVKLSFPSGYRFWHDQICGFRRYFVCKFKPQVEGSG